MRILGILLVIITLNMPAYGFYLDIYSTNTTPGDDYIELGLYDSFGGYTGYDTNNPRNFIRNLPDFIPGAFVSSDFANEEPITHYIEGSKPDGTNGTYKLVVYGQRLAIYGIKGVMKEQSNTTGDGVFYINGITDIGQISYIQLDYTPNQPVVITRIATPTDLIADLTTAQKLNLIGNAHFISETIEKINEIEKERLEPQKPDDTSDKEKKKENESKLTPAQKAKKEYQELLKEITEKYNKPESDEFVKEEAYDVLKEDLEYIISHIQ